MVGDKPQPQQGGRGRKEAFLDVSHVEPWEGLPIGEQAGGPKMLRELKKMVKGDYSIPTWADAASWPLRKTQAVGTHTRQMIVSQWNVSMKASKVAWRITCP